MIGKIQVNDTLSVEWGVIEVGDPSEIGPYVLIERENDVAFVNLSLGEVPDLIRALLEAAETLDARAAIMR